MPTDKPESDWKKKLTPEQYRVLREKGTEAPYSGSLLYNKEQGFYACAACGQKLFTSQAKYDSTTPGLLGWPSFDDVMSSGAVELTDDLSLGMRRTEVICSKCKSHLGHVFPDDSSPTGEHYCINSVAINFEKQAKD